MRNAGSGDSDRWHGCRPSTSRFSGGAPGIAAVVATEETRHYVNWLVSLRLQKPRLDRKARELIDELQAMFTERLKHWKQKNSCELPKQIIVYGDGVSDDFWQDVQDHEIPWMKQAWTVSLKATNQF